MNAFLIIMILIVALILFYLFILRPWQLNWGSTKEEVLRALPGDEIVKKTNFVGTRALNINAPPEEVWKWIIQIGSSRAGWYSIDLLDNANIPSSKVILPEYQKIENDYFIPFTPNQKNGMWVKEFQPFEYILWWDKKVMALGVGF